MEKISGKYHMGGAPDCIGRGFPASLGGIVNHIIMEEAGGMEKFKDHCQSVQVNWRRQFLFFSNSFRHLAKGTEPCCQ